MAIPVSFLGDALDVVIIETASSATLGVLGTTRNRPPKESNFLMLPSFLKSGTECDRWMGLFCKVRKSPRVRKKNCLAPNCVG